eukprot:scaffold23379_cov71-Phaeocystis_antarctica.AAC.7
MRSDRTPTPLAVAPQPRTGRRALRRSSGASHRPEPTDRGGGRWLPERPALCRHCGGHVFGSQRESTTKHVPHVAQPHDQRCRHQGTAQRVAEEHLGVTGPRVSQRRTVASSVGSRLPAASVCSRTAPSASSSSSAP